MQIISKKIRVILKNNYESPLFVRHRLESANNLTIIKNNLGNNADNHI